MTAYRHRVMEVRAERGITWRTDELTGEEPLEIRVQGAPLAVTMRTPGADFDLAAGFLVTEGLIGDVDEILRMRMCPHDSVEGTLNVVDVTLNSPGVRPTAQRNFAMTSSCGVCGKASIESVRTKSRFVVDDDPLTVDVTTLTTLPESLRAAQAVFSRTGGLHAAGLFDAAGALVCVREDVGRHNAFDKVIGWAAGKRMLPLRSHIMLVSGRASFELTQKALMAGIPVLAAVSAPSNLAVALAEEVGMTLVGFLRGDRMNVYAGYQRITGA